jgi:hypothetical protein
MEQTKVIIEMQTRFKIELVLNRFKDGKLISGREYLGPLEADWYPRGRAPWQVIEAFVGSRNDVAMGTPLVRIDMIEFEIGLQVLPSEMPVRENGLRWVDVVYAYPTGERPNWPFVPPLPITKPPGHREPGEVAAGLKTHPVEVSDSDDEPEIVMEVKPLSPREQAQEAAKQTPEEPALERPLERPLERKGTTETEKSIPGSQTAEHEPTEEESQPKGVQGTKEVPECLHTYLWKVCQGQLPRCRSTRRGRCWPEWSTCRHRASEDGRQ